MLNTKLVVSYASCKHIDKSLDGGESHLELYVEGLNLSATVSVEQLLNEYDKEYVLAHVIQEISNNLSMSNTVLDKIGEKKVIEWLNRKGYYSSISDEGEHWRSNKDFYY